MDREERKKKAKRTLTDFKKKFEEYSEEISSRVQSYHGLKIPRTYLQQKQLAVSVILFEILGNGRVKLVKYEQIFSYESLVSTALMGGPNENEQLFRDFRDPVIHALNQAIGAIEEDIWPPKEHIPVLAINDTELKNRCTDLLKAPENYDRVIREATTVLENRLRNKYPHEKLAELIPQSADQSGEKLVNKLLNASNSLLIYSTDQRERAAFQKMMTGVFAYLRNPYHHTINKNIEWSWAWSVVGLIDRLLLEIDSCEVQATE